MYIYTVCISIRLITSQAPISTWLLRSENESALKLVSFCRHALSLGASILMAQDLVLEPSTMQVTAVSGKTLAQLDEDELHCMVESGKTVRDLK